MRAWATRPAAELFAENATALPLEIVQALRGWSAEVRRIRRSVRRDAKPRSFRDLSVQALRDAGAYRLDGLPWAARTHLKAARRYRERAFQAWAHGVYAALRSCAVETLLHHDAVALHREGIEAGRGMLPCLNEGDRLLLAISNAQSAERLRGVGERRWRVVAGIALALAGREPFEEEATP